MGAGVAFLPPESRADEEAEMVIAVQLDIKDGTLDQYDQVIAKMGFRPDKPTEDREVSSTG